MRSALVRHAALVALLGSTPLAAQAPGNPRVDSIFAQLGGRGTPGCAVAVMRNGAIVYERGYGMANLEHDVPNTPETIFDLGSTAKQFTAMSILLLERDGKLSLDDDVRRHIPELPFYGDTIRIRHLLTHTSGLRDYIGLLTMGGARVDDVTTEEDALAAIVRQKALNFAPGTQYLYSNSGYFLLSVIAKRASGMSLRDFARQRIFDPLGMTQTHYLAGYDSVVPRRAVGYSPREGGGYRMDVSRWLQTGDGGVSSSVRELALWDENFYRRAIGDSTLFARMHETARLRNGDTLDYALGLQVRRHRGARTVSHGGSWGGFRAELLRFPDHHFSVATLCNVSTANPSALSMRVAEAYLGEVLAPVAARPSEGRTARPSTRSVRPATPAGQLAGVYRDPGSGETMTVVASGDTLLLVLGARRYPLEPLGGHDFALVNAPPGSGLTIQPATRTRPRTLTPRGSGAPRASYEAIEVVNPTSAELAAYAGSYFSEELQAPYTVVVQNDALEVHARNQEPISFRPSIRDEFTTANGTTVLRFRRDGSGAPTSFTLGIGRVRGLRFERTSGFGIRD